MPDSTHPSNLQRRIHAGGGRVLEQRKSIGVWHTHHAAGGGRREASGGAPPWALKQYFEEMAAAYFVSLSESLGVWSLFPET